MLYMSHIMLYMSHILCFICHTTCCICHTACCICYIMLYTCMSHIMLYMSHIMLYMSHIILYITQIFSIQISMNAILCHVRIMEHVWTLMDPTPVTVQMDGKAMTARTVGSVLMAVKYLKWYYTTVMSIHIHRKVYC